MAGTHHFRFRGRRRTGGFVVIMVLVMITLASFLLMKFVDRAGTELLADARAGGQARLRKEAYSVLEVALAVVADVRAMDNNLQAPGQGWGRPLERIDYQPSAGMTVEVLMQDESGKLSLPQADFPALTSLFTALGASKDNAEKMADALLVWTSADYTPVSVGADGAAYERAPLPHEAPHRALRSFEEIAAIEVLREFFYDESGQLTPLAREFAANVSLYSFPKTNINAATQVLLTAAGLNTTQGDTLTEHRRQQATAGGPGYFRGMNEVTTLLGPADMTKFGTEVSALRVVVSVRSGAATYRVEAVVAMPGGATVAARPAPPVDAKASGGTTSVVETAVPEIKKLDYPFKVLEIREDVESPQTAPTEPDKP